MKKFASPGKNYRGPSLISSAVQTRINTERKPGQRSDRQPREQTRTTRRK